MTPTYIGKTGKIAFVLFKQITNLRQSKDPCDRRLLFTGAPGLGKTDLAERLASALTGEDVDRIRARLAVNVEVINGQSCTIEVVRKWQDQGIYRPLFGDCRVIICDEIDAISNAALNEIRSYLDRLPLATVFIATTNKQIGELQEQLQSRFKVYYFEPVPADDISGWLQKEYGLTNGIAKTIAAGSKGNVRAAKQDALAMKELQP